LYDQINAQLYSKVRLLKAKVAEGISHGCTTWTVRSEDFDSLRTAHHKLSLHVVGFCRENRTGCKTLPYRV
ncbi:unnamed protein product, partial [Sphacelaria rigidula]